MKHDNSNDSDSDNDVDSDDNDDNSDNDDDNNDNSDGNKDDKDYKGHNLFLFFFRPSIDFIDYFVAGYNDITIHRQHFQKTLLNS